MYVVGNDDHHRPHPQQRQETALYAMSVLSKEYRVHEVLLGILLNDVAKK